MGQIYCLNTHFVYWYLFRFEETHHGEEFNPLRPTDLKWHQRPKSTQVQVMQHQAITWSHDGLLSSFRPLKSCVSEISFVIWKGFIKECIWMCYLQIHNDVITWNHSLHYWSFVRESTSPGWFPSQRASNAEFWRFIWWMAVMLQMITTRAFLY